MQDRKLVVAASLLTLMLLAGGFVNTLYAGNGVEIDEFPNSIAEVQIELLDDNGLSDTVMVSGPTTILARVGPNGEVPFPQDPPIPEQVPIEILSMSLTGVSPIFGPVMITTNPDFPSLGQIIENQNNMKGILDVPPFAPGTAMSFFDVFVRIEVAGMTLHNIEPARVQAEITHKPPAQGEKYCGEVGVLLFDSSGNPVARIVTACHTPNPPPPPPAVGGEILPIDMTSLYVAGAFTNAFWILPVLGAIGGAVAGAVIAIRVRRRKIK